MARPEPSRSRWARLGLLLAVLAGLVFYGVGSGRLSHLDLGSGSAAAVAGCESGEVPPLAMVDRSQMIERVHLLERIGAAHGGAPYEWGPAETGFVWNDEEPGVAALPSESPQPGGYEMRWWFPDGSDVVIDSFEFGDPAAAREYLALAASRDCRADASTAAAELPPAAKNLAWENPDGFAQEDALLQRGLRVYRVSVVLPGVGARVVPEERREGFGVVNRLACELPGAGCLPEGGSPS